MQTHNPRHGINTYHSHKQRVLGNPAAQPAPAWRANAKTASGSGSELGSKILLSRLPTDVVENEVEVRRPSISCAADPARMRLEPSGSGS